MGLEIPLRVSYMLGICLRLKLSKLLQDFWGRGLLLKTQDSPLAIFDQLGQKIQCFHLVM